MTATPVAPAATTQRTFASLTDFLTHAAPGDRWDETSADGRTVYTHHFIERQGPEDSVHCRDGAVGGIVETLTTTHRGKADYVDHKPEYAYWSYLATAPVFSDGTFVTHAIRANEARGRCGTVAVVEAKRFSRTRIVEAHAAARRHAFGD